MTFKIVETTILKTRENTFSSFFFSFKNLFFNNFSYIFAPDKPISAFNNIYIIKKNNE